ncbi:hypothetical protein RGR602_CH00623 [Rhizobium gallicum bv. gallicum R602sp]|uniref:Uncharacterized protein n=1 Tax=Rhizobium gallicum bv. gallicum R602sp TaxID=1041138 RepID=A0A0B4X0C0_9HYPH|nr:hypothetical protein RGR602_CH00623 [Rhizobium gallicum bv. gallicum R602sp]
MHRKSVQSVLGMFTQWPSAESLSEHFAESHDIAVKQSFMFGTTGDHRNGSDAPP